MRPADLAAVEAVAEQVHADYPEDHEVFAERLGLFPFGCHVLDGPAGISGYVIAHPWRRDAPPALNSRLSSLPDRPATLYIHDLALLPALRGKGVARRMVRAQVALAISFSLPELALVAVGGSAPFWEAQGFSVAALPELAAKLASYDSGACYMRRVIG